ncbi:MAG: hypothetical protein JSV62_01235, partial [Promethearchaeota archaeon]
MIVREIKGRPKFESGKFLGYLLWKQSDGFHLRWTTKGKKPHSFQGRIVYHNKLRITRKFMPRTGLKVYEVAENMIYWNSIEERKTSGIDFFTPGNFTLELRIDEKKIKPKMIILGSQMKNPKSNPFIIIQMTEEKISEKEIKRMLGIKIKEPLKEIEPKAIYEPVYQRELEPVYEPEPEPVYEPEPEPVYEPEPEPVYEPEPEPVYEPEPEPVYEPEPEPV